MKVRHGLDVSHYQGQVDWRKVATRVNGFAVVKATEGLTYTDPTFARNWAAILKAGFSRRGAYHFLHPELSGAKQADYFHSRLSGLGGKALLWCDVEVTKGKAPAAIFQCVKAFMRRLEQLAEHPERLFVYTSRGFWTFDPGDLKRYGLALAAYDGTITQPPSLRGWPATIKQFSQTGKVPGIAGNVDRDVYYGGF
jgi:lysozyme